MELTSFYLLHIFYTIHNYVSTKYGFRLEFCWKSSTSTLISGVNLLFLLFAPTSNFPSQFALGSQCTLRILEAIRLSKRKLNTVPSAFFFVNSAILKYFCSKRILLIALTLFECIDCEINCMLL